MSKTHVDKPKIVIWDLETLPDPRQVYNVIPSFGAWPGRGFKAELQSIMSFGYKIYGEKKTHCVNIWDIDPNWQKNKYDDHAIVQFAYEMLKDADEIVTHNGKSFDVKVLNTRLTLHGLPPIPQMSHVDTKISAKKLSLYSNSLANVAKFFGLDDKMSFTNKWSLWSRIAFNESTAKDRKLMSDYCKQDVDTLEQVYTKLMPYHGSNSVNKNFWSKGNVCPTCGSKKVHKHGVKRTKTTEYRRFLCQDCGSVSQASKKGDLS